MGLVSKKRTGALSTLANILLWTTLAAFISNIKNKIVRKVPEIANNPTSPPYIPIRWSSLSKQVDLFRLVSDSQSALTVINHKLLII